MNPISKNHGYLLLKNKRAVSVTGLAFIFSLILTFNCYAQKKIVVKSVDGIAYVNDDITPRQAKSIALKEAKEAALRKAGIKEVVSATNILTTSQRQKKVEQNFVEISTVELNGAILTYKITDEKRSIDAYNNFKIVLTIDATVVKYKTNKDPSFAFKVEGINNSYLTGDNLSFTFTPYQNGYLKIFLISKDTSQIIYPFQSLTNKRFSDIQNRLFKENSSVVFPLLEWMKYSLTCRRSKEFNQLIFVFTKKNIPFTSKVTNNNIHKWIYSISPDQRVIKNYIFEIKNTVLN